MSKEKYFLVVTGDVQEAYCHTHSDLVLAEGVAEYICGKYNCTVYIASLLMTYSRETKIESVGEA